MGWERRGSRDYAYRSQRVDGKSVKVYLGRDDARGRLRLFEANERLTREAHARRLTRDAETAFCRDAEAIGGDLRGCDAVLRSAVEGLLYAAGFHKHHRSEWRRMDRELRALARRIEAFKSAAAKPKPAFLADAPAGDAEAVDLFARARAGDATARDKLRSLVADRGWVSQIGDLGRRATKYTIRRAAGSDPVGTVAMEMRAEEMLRGLTGPNPTLIEELLARRVVNSWLAVSALEVDMAVREPADRRAREALDRMIGRAQRRLTEAARELARVRRLVLPDLFAGARVTITAAAPTAAVTGGQVPQAMNKEE